jgi:CelD/BcsL family acetyltransferase involved in cellulose biosynthesis
MDFIIAKTYLREVYSAINSHFEQLIQTGEVTSVCLLSIPANSPTLNQLKVLNLPNLEKKQQDVTSQIPLPIDWDTYLGSLDRKQRHEVRRKWRKLENGLPYQFYRVEEAGELTEAIPDFIRLHQLSSPTKHEFWTKLHLQFFEQLLINAFTAKALALFFLEIEGQRVSTMLGFSFHQHFYLYNSGYNPDLYQEISTGSVLVAHTINWALEHNFKVYDFLRGDETYKFRFGAQAQSVWDLRTATL